MAKIGIDMDGVLANFNFAYAALLEQVSGQRLFHEGYRGDPNWPATWNYARDAGYEDYEHEAWQRILSPATKFWESLDALPGIGQTIHTLDQLSQTHDVYFITTRPGPDAKQQTEEWLMEQGMFNPTVLISTGNKLPLIQGLGLDAFIDDKPENVQHLSKPERQTDGVWLTEWTPVCKQTFIVDAPYNRVGICGGVTRVKNVQEALDILTFNQEI